MRQAKMLFLLLLLLTIAPDYADEAEKSTAIVDLAQVPYAKLSQYGFFQGKLAAQKPKSNVIPYDVSNALFSDYTDKRRFVCLPPGTSARYHPRKTFAFPVGTVLIKTFSLPRDMRNPAKGEQILETRLLVRHKDQWKAYPYIWNDEQTDAELEIAGDYLDVEWIHSDGRSRENTYVVPNTNECKGCHASSNNLVPIGLKAKFLNRSLPYQSGDENQLEHWHRRNFLQDAPKREEIPHLAIWHDANSGTLEQRARAYLDINCAHCHHPQGPASNSGLDLRSEQTSLPAIGVFKAPVAAGRGSGGRHYDIVPGAPDASILLYRMNSREPGIAMPEFGSTLVHEEAVELIRQWIEAMQKK